MPNMPKPDSSAIKQGSVIMKVKQIEEKTDNFVKAVDIPLSLPLASHEEVKVPVDDEHKQQHMKVKQIERKKDNFVNIPRTLPLSSHEEVKVPVDDEHKQPVTDESESSKTLTALSNLALAFSKKPSKRQSAEVSQRFRRI
jgi:hypothetical protein